MVDTISPETHVSEADILRKMEDEHLRLQRQVRVIQQDRNDVKAGVHPQFRRADALLSVLKDEYISLKKDLKIARSGRHKKNSREMKKDLKRSILTMMKTQQEADGGVTLMKQLNDLLLRKSKTMLELKKAVTTSVGELNRRRYQSEARLLSTENRLETTQKRFNSVQSENLRIREEIEHMLRDRAQFNRCWKKMLTVLGKGKKFLNDLFESSTLAYDQRDEWCAKLKSLQEKGKLDQMTQIQEMRDLQKALDHEMKQFQFLSVKGVMRVNRDQEAREEQQRIQNEIQLKEDVRKHWQIIDDIIEYTEVDDIRSIIEDFNKRERENFAIYQLLAEYCAENVLLAKDLKKTRQELEDRRDWNEQTESNCQSAIEKLQSQLEEQKKKTDILRKQAAEQDQILEKVGSQVEGMFKMLNCSLEPYQNLLGDKTPTLRQSSLTLKIITDKIKEYLETAYFCERHMLKKSDRSPGTSRLKTYTVRPELPKMFVANPIHFLVPDETCPACVEARWLSRVVDQDEKPFTREDALRAITELSEDPSYLRSDRVHTITDCRAPRSRVLLAGRYAQK